MRISTKGIYALEIVTDLGLHSGKTNPESVHNIAERRKLSEKYLERIISLLRKAGIVASIRGAHGGYYLEKDADKIRVYDVLIAAEGSLSPVNCLEQKEACSHDCEQCSTRGFWGEIAKCINQVVCDVSIADIIHKLKE